MDLYIFLQAKASQSISFQSPLNNWLQQYFNELVIYDADQKSASLHIHTGIEFIKQAKKIILHFEGDEQINLGELPKILETIRKRKTSTLILHESNKQLLMNLKMIKSDKATDNFKEAIKKFLNPN